MSDAVRPLANDVGCQDGVIWDFSERKSLLLVAQFDAL